MKSNHHTIYHYIQNNESSLGYFIPFCIYLPCFEVHNGPANNNKNEKIRQKDKKEYKQLHEGTQKKGRKKVTRCISQANKKRISRVD